MSRTRDDDNELNDDDERTQPERHDGIEESDEDFAVALIEVLTGKFSYYLTYRSQKRQEGSRRGPIKGWEL